MKTTATFILVSASFVEEENLVDLYEMYVILINFSADIRKLCLLKKMSNTVNMIYIYVGL